MNPSRDSYELRAVLPATLPAVEDLLARARRLWEGSDCRCNFTIELLLRETLTNAVVHGSRNDPERRICCLIRIGRGRLFFVVGDDGSGFDWYSAFRRKSTNEDCSGRGMEILWRYASRVRFNRTGNRVAITKRLR
jgi:serine/threonine-protein kinase RsbW